MRRLVGLDDDLAFLPFSARSTANLLHQLKTSFKCPKIGKREHIVGIEYAYYFNMVEVEAFGDHLSSDKDVCLAVFKLVEDKLIGIFRASGVEVEEIGRASCRERVLW